MATAAVETRRWTREEYERLVEQGFFHPDEHIELIEGVIYEMPPQKSLHAFGVRAVTTNLQAIFGKGFDVRSQMPLALSEDSEPEPDVAVVPGSFTDYIESHPTTAELIVEVADSSLLHDRKRKTGLYAREGIAEYWILNLVKRCLEVYRTPKDGIYTVRLILRDGDSVSPLARPETAVPVASLLPQP